jgi:two-component system KDP operon response regulator KdpE
MSSKILVVDDEPQIGRLLRTSLVARGYLVEVTLDGPSALTTTAKWQPDLVLLDLGLPGMDGLEVCRQIRTWSSVPIIVLTVRDAEQDKVRALDDGADDYLTKPFGIDELLARVRAALRRAAAIPTQSNIIRNADIQIDLAQRRVCVAGKDVHLTPTEYTLLQLLATHPGKVLTHRMLLREVWGLASENDTPTLRVFITQLRHKVEPDPAHPRLILTEPGVGYRFQLEPLA